MKRFFRTTCSSPTVLVVALFVLTGMYLPPVLAGNSPVTDETLKEEIQHAKNEVYPALVNLSVVKKYFHDGESSKKRSVGSGVIVSEDGYGVTNFHVVDQAEKIEGTLSNNQTIEASVVGRDALTDLAVLKFDTADLPEGTATFPYASLGNSDDVEVGDYVLAMGNPLMLAQSVTLGIVSNDRRVFFSEEGENTLEFGDNLQTGLFTEWIQHDASISPGSSGGPLVNLDGQVVGINARGSSRGGDMGFSIPSNQVDAIVERLIENPQLQRSWIGIGIKPLKDTPYDTGVLINSVTNESPADRAGIQPGDRITALAEANVSVHFTEQLASFYRKIAELPVGDTVRLTLRREGEELVKSLRTERLKNRRGKKASLKHWGFNVQEITPFDRRVSREERTRGVRISSVKSGGPAEDAKPRLQSGDVIHAFEGDTVQTYTSFLDDYYSRTETETSPRDVLLGLKRNGASLYSVLEPEANQEVVDRPRPLGNAWIGVRTQVVTSELQKQLEAPVNHGVRVTKIFEDTLAAESNLRIGDLITSVGDRSVKARQDYQDDLFATMVERMTVGDTAQLTVYRGEDREHVVVELEAAPLKPDQVSSYKQNTFDFTVRGLTFFDRKRWDWPETAEGVVVKSVESGGWAGVGGLQSNDLITSINGDGIESIEEIRDILKNILRKKPDSIGIMVRRRNKRRQLFLTPDWYKNSTERTESH